MFAINIAAKVIFSFLAKLVAVNSKNKNKQKHAQIKKKKIRKKKKKKRLKRDAAYNMCTILAGSAMLTGCVKSRGASSVSDQVVIYSNADDEAVVTMKKALDENGYKGEYMFQTFGTSELGGKLLAEGKNIEADLVTMSSFYVESAQQQNGMFKDLTFDTGALE